jgi:protoheme IX farnesyltransferase
VLPYATGLFGAIYLVVALTLGVGFVGLALHLLMRPSRAAAIRLHLASLFYLAVLFGAMATDRVILA